MNRLLVIGRCACHQWVLDAMSQVGTCGRCGQEPQMIGAANGASTLCLHEGPCRG